MRLSKYTTRLIIWIQIWSTLSMGHFSPNICPEIRRKDLKIQVCLEKKWHSESLPILSQLLQLWSKIIAAKFWCTTWVDGLSISLDSFLSSLWELVLQIQLKATGVIWSYICSYTSLWFLSFIRFLNASRTNTWDRHILFLESFAELKIIDIILNVVLSADLDISEDGLNSMCWMILKEEMTW